MAKSFPILRYQYRGAGPRACSHCLREFSRGDAVVKVNGCALCWPHGGRLWREEQARRADVARAKVDAWRPAKGDPSD